MAEAELLQEVATRIIQHYWRVHRAGSKAASDPAPPIKRQPPHSAQRGPAAAVTVATTAAQRLKEQRAGRGWAKPPKPPRPRTSQGQRPRTAAAAPAAPGKAASRASRPTSSPCPLPPESDVAKLPAAKASTGSPPAEQALQLEDSAQRVGGHSSNMAAAAAQGDAKVAAVDSSSLQQELVPPQQLQVQQQEQEQLPLNPRASVASERLSNILHFLDELEAKASEEVASVQPVMPHPLASAMASQPSCLSTCRLAAQAAGDPAVAQGLAAAGSSRFAMSCADVLQRGRSAVTSTAALANSDIESPRQPSSAAQPQAGAAPQQQAVPPRLSQGAAAPAQDAGLLSAVAVADSVRGKIQRLQQQLQQKEQEAAALAAQAQQAQQAHAHALQAAMQQHQAQLAAQQADHEATMARNMAFIDRILADKDALSDKCAALGRELQAARAECLAQIEALKESLAKELRKQKDGWLAAERAKREAWMAEQTRSIKESTVRGLEPEIARLVELHKAELKRAELRHEADCSRRLQAAAAQHEQHVAQLRQQWAADKAAAVEAEKEAARNQAKDAQQWFELELQGMRMRLATEHEMQMARADAARREERGRVEERTEQLAREQEQRIALIRSEAAEERSAAARQHQRELEALKEKYETGQEAWRAAMAERAKQEYEAREATLRRQLLSERDAEIRGVIARLEEEFLAKESALQEELAEKEAAAEQRWAAEVSRLRASEAQLRQACGATEARVAAGEERAARLEELVHTLQREVASKATSTAWLEEQLASSKRTAAAKEERMAEALAAKDAEAAQQRSVLEGQLSELQGQLEAARAEAESARAKSAAELGQVEGRVRAALALKDEAIAALRQQLDTITLQLEEAGVD